MKQYCRYCAHAIDYNGDEVDFICTANADCGHGGAGVMYSANKAKRPNNCKHFSFNEIDVFGGVSDDGKYKTYKPRTVRPAVQVLHGGWEIIEEANCVDTYGNPSKYAKCTNCGFRWNDLYSVKKYFVHCPNCGAKMDGGTS